MSLVEVLAPLRRHWRLIVLGIGGSWAVLILLLLLAPPRYRCEATLGVPNVIPPAKPKPNFTISIGSVSQPMAAMEYESAEAEGPWKSGSRTGIPPLLYQKVEPSLQDGARLQSVLGGIIEPDAIERLGQALGDHVSPLMSEPPEGPGDEKVVGAINLSHESYSADRSGEVVSALASLVREALITAIARDLVAWEAQASERAIRSLIQRKEELLEANRSLERLAADLERLAKGMPEPGMGGTREVVDTSDGGYLYLPPRLQLVGAKARSATNEHTIRTYDRALDRHALRLSFLRRLDERLAETGTSTADLPETITAELEEFVQEQRSNGPETRSLEAEVESLAEQMAGLVAQTRFIRQPTVGTVSRTTLAVALASMAAVFFIAAAFLVDLWQRTPLPGADAAGIVARPPE